MTPAAPDPRIALDLPLRLGEGPIWHGGEQCLFFVDILGKAVYRFDPARGEVSTVFDGETVAGITIQDDGSLLLFQDAGRISQLRAGGAVPIRPPIVQDAGTRFNDVIADPEGRVYCGTMPSENQPGRLYLLDLDGTITEVIADAGISNGMDFLEGGRAMLHTNTQTGEISRYDRDPSTGLLGNRRVVVVPTTPGSPDGMKLDTDDTIWSARYGGSGVYHYDLTGNLLGHVPLPAANTTSVAFGGEGFRTLFVTSAGGEDRARNGEYAGALFSVEPGVAGRPAHRSRIQVTT